MFNLFVVKALLFKREVSFFISIFFFYKKDNQNFLKGQIFETLFLKKTFLKKNRKILGGLKVILYL